MVRDGAIAPPHHEGREVWMRFDLVDLQLFVAVAETRSITNGAQRVHLALASGSERIKGLEDAFGVALLTRGRRGVELTPAGESLPDHARVVLHNVEAMRGDLLAFSSGAKVTVRFLANTSGLSEYLPKTLGAFLAAPPHISIDVQEPGSFAIACPDHPHIRQSRETATALPQPAPSSSAAATSGCPPNSRVRIGPIEYHSAR